ncbi:MAG: MerR family transcriptional regulator [Gemmatimonadetes bacterium]|nr:MerR family transcriptional regulator [Gemmatimonadota bacterium]
MVERDRRVNQQEEEQRQGAVEPIPIKARPDDLALEPRGQSPRKGGDSGDQEVQGVYIISVAARLLEMHPQTLRKYERLGLVSPSRTVGMLRLYSDEDIDAHLRSEFQLAVRVGQSSVRALSARAIVHDRDVVDERHDVFENPPSLAIQDGLHIDAGLLVGGVEPERDVDRNHESTLPRDPRHPRDQLDVRVE